MGTTASVLTISNASANDIASLLANIGDAYQPYQNLIIENGVDGSVLDSLKDQENDLKAFLSEIGISNKAHQIVICQQIKKLFSTVRSLKPSSSIPLLISLAKGKFHAFLSHNWGLDQLNRDNHLRVRRIYELLKVKFGIIAWFDEEKMEGDIRAKMAEGIENSYTFVMFVTQSYQDKVNGKYGESDNCKFEFQFGLRKMRKIGNEKNIITVLQEPNMRDSGNWTGVFGAEVGGLLYIDLSSDEETLIDKGCEELARRILSGASFLNKEENSQESLTAGASETTSLVKSASKINTSHQQETSEASKKPEETNEDAAKEERVNEFNSAMEGALIGMLLLRPSHPKAFIAKYMLKQLPPEKQKHIYEKSFANIEDEKSFEIIPVSAFSFDAFERKDGESDRDFQDRYYEEMKVNETLENLIMAIYLTNFHSLPITLGVLGWLAKFYPEEVYLAYQLLEKDKADA